MEKGEILIATDKTEYEAGETLKVKIENKFQKQICFSTCYPYFLENKNENWKSYEYTECHEFNGNGHCIKAGDLKAFELTLPQNVKGSHRLAIPICIGCQSEDIFQEDKRFYSNEFTIKEKKDETADWKTYRNEEYKFSLKFPPSWEGYKTKKRILKWGGFGTSDSIDFGFPVQESLFNISIHAKTQWNNIISGEGPHPTHIAENEKFIFTYATAQDAANNEIVERMKEIKDIISTFRFLE